MAGREALRSPDTAVSGGAWLKKDVVPPFFAIDPTGLPVGTSSGSITFTSNAVNGTWTVPVDLQIVPKGTAADLFPGCAEQRHLRSRRHGRPRRRHGRQRRAAFVQPLYARASAALANQGGRHHCPREWHRRAPVLHVLRPDRVPNARRYARWAPRSSRCSATTARSAIRRPSRSPPERRDCSSRSTRTAASTPLPARRMPAMS